MTAGKDATITPVASLKEFFRDSVDAALASNHVVVAQATSHYVVDLLTLFARAEFFGEDAPGGGRKPLALMLCDAADAATLEERKFVLQRLGDVALFLSGFFPDGLDRSVVGRDYYVYMGGGAYGLLAAQLRGGTRARALAEVFAELASRFGDLVDVLNEVRDSARGCRDDDMLRLYEAWTRTGSRRAARLLRQAGVEPGARSIASLRH
jgi:hypothetical protein